MFLTALLFKFTKASTLACHGLLVDGLDTSDWWKGLAVRGALILML